jgi:hypothetical protein
MLMENLTGRAERKYSFLAFEKRFSIKTLLEALPLLFKEGTQKVASFMWGQNQRKYEGKK